MNCSFLVSKWWPYSISKSFCLQPSSRWLCHLHSYGIKHPNQLHKKSAQWSGRHDQRKYFCFYSEYPFPLFNKVITAQTDVISVSVWVGLWILSHWPYWGRWPVRCRWCTEAHMRRCWIHPLRSSGQWWCRETLCRAPRGWWARLELWQNKYSRNILAVTWTTRASHLHNTSTLF